MTIGTAKTIDVRDMECAQALAQVGAAMRRLANGETLDVTCNAPDVKDDLLVWARALGHVVLVVDDRVDEVWLRIQRGDSNRPW